MNAKHLTLICSVSALLGANWLLLPQWTAYKRLHGEAVAMSGKSKQLDEVVQIASAFPARPMNLLDRATALAAAVNVWTASQRQYGIRLSQVTLLTSAGGQDAVPVTQAGQIDELTKLAVQRVAIKGQYESLVDLRRYLEAEFNAEQAVVIERLSLVGESFELDVGIYSRAD